VAVRIGGEWNYLTNRDEIYRYWERRIEANGRYENIYTLGMPESFRR